MVLDSKFDSSTSPPYKNKMANYTIKNKKDKGNGLFSTVDIDAGQVVLQFIGKPVLYKDVPDLKQSDNLLQIDKDLYLDLKGHPSNFCNHDCNPNSFVKIAIKNAFLIAARPIKIGEEICFDYSATSTDTPEMWSMKCNCHPFNCRRLISGFSTVPDKQKARMISLGMVPKYVL